MRRFLRVLYGVRISRDIKNKARDANITDEAWRGALKTSQSPYQGLNAIPIARDIDPRRDFLNKT